MNSQLSIKGRVEIILRKGDEIVSRIQKDNLVTDSGAALAGDLLLGTADPISHIALGSGSQVAAKSDTALQTELKRSAMASTSRSNNIVQYTAQFDGDWAGTIAEAGLFNGIKSSGESMFSRIVLDDTVQKANIVVVEVTWSLEIK